MTLLLVPYALDSSLAHNENLKPESLTQAVALSECLRAQDCKVEALELSHSQLGVRGAILLSQVMSVRPRCPFPLSPTLSLFLSLSHALSLYGGAATLPFLSYTCDPKPEFEERPKKELRERDSARERLRGRERERERDRARESQRESVRERERALAARRARRDDPLADHVSPLPSSLSLSL